MTTRTNAAFTALLAAALFGATTPLAKILLGTLSPFTVAGLFYLGSGVGLTLTLLISICAATPKNEKMKAGSGWPRYLGSRVRSLQAA